MISLPLVRRALVPAMLFTAACARSAPATDSAVASAPAGSVASAPVPVPPTPPVALAPDTMTRIETRIDTPSSKPARSTPPAAPPAASPSRSDTVSTDRPGLTPRRPHPVPLPMPGRQTAVLTADSGGGDQASDQAMLDRLRREARALAHVDGCASSGQCAVQPIGLRACGGPSEYLVYCPKSTDVAALKRKADEIARADKAFNTKYHIMSTCEYRLAPTAQLVGGQCKAATSTGAPGPSR